MNQYLNYDLSGLTQALRHNEEIHECLKELSCKYDVSKYVSPESRLIMAISMSAYAIYNQNNMKHKFNAFLEKPVDEKTQNAYKIFNNDIYHGFKITVLNGHS